jgi:hypothetical protein
MSVVIDSDNNNIDIVQEPINVTISTGGADVSAVWGNISGDLTDQEDLQAALDEKVPYTGATQDVNLGEFGAQLGNLEFDTTPTNTPTGAGSVYWSDTDGTLNLVLKGGQTISRIGETQHIRALNNTGTQIARGKVVYVTGAQGQRLTVALADADTELLSKDTIGFTSEAIADGAEGFVIVQGVINNISTTGMTDGATVYLSQTAGGYTTTPPPDPAHLVILGFIVNGGSGGAGSIYVKVDNGYELEELHNISDSEKATAVDADAVLLRDSADNNLWKRLTWANVKSTLKTYFDTLYQGTLTFDNTPTNGSTNPVTSDGVFDALTLKQDNVTLTTTGTSGAATLVGATLNIPQYQSVLTNPVTGTGVAGQVSYWSGTGTQTGSANLFWDAANNRLGVGLNSSITARLHVRGSGTTSATTALLVQNSTPTDILTVRDDNKVIAHGGIFTGGANTVAGILPQGTINQENILIRSSVFPATTSITDITLTNGQGDPAHTSGTRNLVNINRNFSPTSGSGIYNLLLISSTINQTGGANGITRGMYLNPTLTAAADWRSVEWSNNTGWGIYGAGTANNYLAGGLGIGTTTLNNSALAIQRNMTGTTSVISVNNTSVVQSDVTSVARYFATTATTQAATFNLSLLIHYSAGQASFGINSTVTNQYGYFVSSGLTGATNNFAFRGEIASSANNWNLYMSGTAANYLAGNTSIGTTTSSGRLTVRGSGTTSATNGLLIEDSGGTDTLTIRDDGGYAFKGGTVGLAQTGYTTFTNLVTDRTCDANATTVDELADILGTLIEDLKTKGIISA